jgi:hypothetical protein
VLQLATCPLLMLELLTGQTDVCCRELIGHGAEGLRFLQLTQHGH